MPFIAGSGNVNVDMIYGGLERLPEYGEEIYSKSFGLYLGGGAPATLINLSRLHVDVKLATYLADDLFSRFAQGEIEKCGADYQNLHEGGDCPVNLTTAILTPGERTFVTYAGQPSCQNLEEKLYSAMCGAAYIIMERGHIDLYKRLKAEGVKLVFDTGWDEEMSIDTYRPYLELADYFVPNRKEALKITGKTDIEEAAKALAPFFQDVIIKLDSEGTYLFKNGQGKIIRSIPEFVHKDSTGAGDAFLSGLLYGLINGFPIEKAVLCANLTGGKCVTERGCLTAYLTENELLDKLIQYLPYTE